jgi:SAM-dependent methyltransferase
MIKFNKNPISTESGIYIYSTDDFYWFTDISRDKIRLLYERLGSQDLFSACQNVGIKTGYLADYYRSDFIYFLPYKNNEDFSVLDLGSGFGNITIPLSKKMPKASIFAVDGSLDILKILSRRIEKEARNNVSLVKVGAFENMDLPFVQKSFDLIIMNGVLEWIGSGKDKGIPKSIQIEFLKYIKTLLKDNGNLYIGIEGRFFPGYFFNVKDPHSGIMFTSILPRSLSDFVCKLKGKKEGYRTYTYSSKGYLSLFKKAGFKSENIEMIYPVASYKDPYNLFSVKDKKSYSYAFKRLYKKIFPTIKSILLNKILYFLNLEKFFAASYLFNIGNSNQTDNRLLDFYLKDFVNPDEFEPIKIQSNLSNNGFVNFILLSKKDGCPKYFFKIKR